MAYQEFLRANGINPEDLSQKEYSDLLNTQDMYNDDLIHFSKSENCKDVCTSSSVSRAEAPGEPHHGRKVEQLGNGGRWQDLGEVSGSSLAPLS